MTKNVLQTIMHNIALLLDLEGKYHTCPIFDNGDFKG